MSLAQIGPLITTDRLADCLDDKSIRIVDASWYLPAMNRNGRNEYDNAHIPGSVFWDIDTIANVASDFPHMMPSADQFEMQMSELGISNDTTVVVYDGLGVFSAARPWWMLKAFGHTSVYILDGGLPKWMAEGCPLNSEKSNVIKGHYSANLNPNYIRTADDLLNNLHSKSEQIVDARPNGRFRGSEEEPRPGCRSGHIPNSFNLPFDHLIDPQTKTLLPQDALRKRYKNVGIDINQPVITSCGSGVTACILALGMHVMEKPNVAVYDGSWSEWGTKADLPIQTG